MRATQKELGKMLGVSEHVVRALVKDNVLPTPGTRGAYDVGKCVLAYVEHLRMTLPTAPPTAELQSLRVAIARHKLATLERDAALAARTLIDTKAVEAWCTKNAQVARGKLEALPGMLKAKIPHLRSSELAIVKGEVAKIARDIIDFDVDG